MSLGDTFSNSGIDGGATYYKYPSPNPLESIYKLTDASGTDHQLKISQSSTKSRKRSVIRMDWTKAPNANGVRESASVYIVADSPTSTAFFTPTLLYSMLHDDLLVDVDATHMKQVFSGQI